ncbi:MAG: hypothetical protein ABI977_38015, partial [Acidobacteriota bacterium]
MKNQNPGIAKWKLAAGAMLCVSLLLLLTHAGVRRLAQRTFNARPAVAEPAKTPALRARAPIPAAPVFAPFDIPRSVIAGGGGQNGNAGNFTLEGTIAQSALGSTSAGNFGLIGGFWPGDTALSPAISKNFGAATILVGGVTSLNFTINNPNTATALNNVSFTDTLPTGLVVDTPNGLSGSCGGGTITATQNTGIVSLSGAVLAASGSCTFSVNVKGTIAGQKDNTVSVTATEASGVTPGTATLTVIGAPALTKAFTPATVVTGQSSSLGFTITNSNTTVALSGIQFTDTLPAGLTVGTSGPTAACGGTYSTTAPGTISFTGGTLAAGNPNPTTCTFSVNVATAMAGTFNNTSGVITATESGPGATSNQATLTVNQASTTTTITNAGALGTATVVGQAYAVNWSVTVNAP